MNTLLEQHMKEYLELGKDKERLIEAKEFILNHSNELVTILSKEPNELFITLSKEPDELTLPLSKHLLLIAIEQNISNINKKLNILFETIKNYKEEK